MDQATLRLALKVSYTLGVIDSSKISESEKTVCKVSNALSTALEDFVIESACCREGDRNANN